MFRSRLYAGGLAIACALVAHAGTISIADVTVLHQYQQTTNSPCVFDNSSCNQPAGFPAALLPVATSYDQDSLTYTVGQIRGIVGDSFFVGMDVNQTSTNQKLSLFSMSIGGSLADSTNILTVGGMEVPPTVGGGNGNGYADYILTGFTSLAGLDANTTVTFHLTMPLVNDGREQFFLLSNNASSVPEPITVALTGSGLLGLFLLRKRFAKS